MKTTDEMPSASELLSVQRCRACEKKRAPLLVPSSVSQSKWEGVRPIPGEPFTRWPGDWFAWSKDGEMTGLCPTCADKRIPGWSTGKDPDLESMERAAAATQESA